MGLPGDRPTRRGGKAVSRPEVSWPEAPVIGVDMGATLAKIVVREPTGELAFGFLPASALELVHRRIEALAPAAVGLTGCAASRLAERLGERPSHRSVEFEAWGRGSRILLERQGRSEDAPYLLVSVGTGTSILEVRNGQTRRLGGTALGGGTVLGLGVALTGCNSYEELAQLAESGNRAQVDLLVGDIYRPGEILLPSEITAASFGKLARWLTHDEVNEHSPSKREDLASAVMGLVGENVALVCCGLAEASGIRTVVYGGATLMGNPALADIVLGVTLASGLEPLLLESGGHAGAVGALALAQEAILATR